MTQDSEGLWPAEHHTIAKLKILRFYLDAWFSILFQYPGTRELVYVDACCGPGRYQNHDSGSPVTALQSASSASNPRKLLVSFHFNDRNMKMITSLRDYIDCMNLASIGKQEFTTKEADSLLVDILNRLDHLAPREGGMVPLFVFIDGWGNIVSMDTVHRILQRRNSEVFILVSKKDVLRNIGNQDQHRIISAFGTDQVLDVRDSERVALYYAQLKLQATFVNQFEMQYSTRDTAYFLFFASRSGLGYKKMKNAMWKVDQWGDLRFCDALSESHEMLFNSRNVALDAITHKLCRKFRGRTVTGKHVSDYVELETNYTHVHKTEILRRLQVSGFIGLPSSEQGIAVRKGTFPPHCIITFPNKLCGRETCPLQA